VIHFKTLKEESLIMGFHGKKQAPAETEEKEYVSSSKGLLSLSVLSSQTVVVQCLISRYS